MTWSTRSPRDLATLPEDYAEWYDLNIEDFRTVDELESRFRVHVPRVSRATGIRQDFHDRLAPRQL